MPVRLFGVPTNRTPRSPVDPRVAKQLDAPDCPLGDGVSWSEVDAGPADSFSGSAADCEIVGSRLKGLRLTGAVIERGRWVDVVLEDCELSGTVLNDATLVRVLFLRCRMSGLIATGAKAQDVRFTDCRVDGANFRGSALDRCAFEDCDLHDADFYAAKFVSGALRRCAGAGRVLKGDQRWIRRAGLQARGAEGAGSLQGAVIGSDQMVPLGIALLATLGIRVEDDEGTSTEQAD